MADPGDARPGCDRHRGDPHNLCEACWAVEGTQVVDPGDARREGFGTVGGGVPLPESMKDMPVIPNERKDAPLFEPGDARQQAAEPTNAQLRATILRALGSAHNRAYHGDAVQSVGLLLVRLQELTDEHDEFRRNSAAHLLAQIDMRKEAELRVQEAERAHGELVKVLKHLIDQERYWLADVRAKKMAEIARRALDEWAA